MAYLSQHGLDTFWAKLKSTFATALDKTEAVDGITIKLKSGSGTELSTTTINAATTTTAGVMTTAQVSKLAEVDDKAPLASPALTGTPTAPTASAGTSTTQIATTAFVATATAAVANQNAFSNVKVGTTTIAADTTTDTLNMTAGDQISISPDASTDTVTISHATTHTAASAAAKKVGMDTYGHVVLGDALAVGDISGAAPLASPALTGTPTAPTASTGTSTTQIATTEFVANSISAVTSGVSGVKGNAETTYRTGDVNITPANIGVEDGAEVNQNAFSNVKVGSTTIAADTKTDTLEIAGGTNITVTPDATNDKVTITHGAYTAATAAAVKVGNDATGHVVIGAALGASDIAFVASDTSISASDVQGALEWVDGQLAILPDRTVQSPNTVYAGPSSGSVGAFPSFRALVAADIPNLDTSKLTSGTLGVARGGTGVGTISGIVYGNGTSAMSAATGAQVVSVIGNNAVANATNATNATNASNSTTQATGTNNTTIATTAFVQQEIAAAQTGAAMYKGTLSQETDLTGLTNYKQGWYWVVDTAWTSTAMGITMDVGNMVFCNTSAATFAAANFDVVAADIEAITDAYINALS